jgi:hypothetical protein
MLGGLETSPLLAGTPRARSIYAWDGEVPNEGADSEPAVHVQEQKVPLPCRKKVCLVKPDEEAVAREHKARRERSAERLVPFLNATKGLKRGALQPGVCKKPSEKARSHSASIHTLVCDVENKAPVKVTMPLLHRASDMSH